MKASAFPSIDALLADPGRVADVPEHAVPGLLAEIAALQMSLAAVQTMLAARMAPAPGTSAPDSLLTVEEAAERLALSKDWLYRNRKDLPFTVHIGSQLRFSSNGIDSFIRQRRGRAAA